MFIDLISILYIMYNIRYKGVGEFFGELKFVYNHEFETNSWKEKIKP